MKHMRSYGLSLLTVVCFTMAGSVCIPASALAAEPKSIAIMDFDLMNDMQEYDSAEVAADQKRRLQLVGDQFRNEFQKRGLYRVVDNGNAAQLIAKVKATYPMRDCKGCEREIGQALGADRVLVGWVQKVSNLILNINIQVNDTASGEIIYNKSVDLRGNTDLSWRRGVNFMIDSIVEKKQYLK